MQQQIVYSDPSGNVVRLQDVARVVKEYPHANSYIKNNGTKCILLSVEMKKGKNIVQMGNDIDRVLEEFKTELPSEVNMFPYHRPGTGWWATVSMLSCVSW